MATQASPGSEYILGRTRAEHHRLNRQGRLIARITRHFLEGIGLAPGMCVLDVGSGTGDLALLAARTVGPSGQVVCVDTDTAALAVAKERAVIEGFANIQFQACDFHHYQTSFTYDALIGRCLLVHQVEPLTALQAVIRNVGPRGIVAFQEPWFSQAFSSPEAPRFQELLRVLHNTLAASGLDGDIGVRLPSLFVAAGLPTPRLSFEMLVDCSAESEIYDFCTDTVRSLLPRIEDLGISTAEKLQLDSLAKRLRMEASALQSVIGVLPLMGAWSNKP